MRFCNARNCSLRESLDFLLGWGFYLVFRVYTVFTCPSWGSGVRERRIPRLARNSIEVSVAGSQLLLWFSWISGKLPGMGIFQRGGWQCSHVHEFHTPLLSHQSVCPLLESRNMSFYCSFPSVSDMWVMFSIMGLLDNRNLELSMSNISIKCLEHWGNSEKEKEEWQHLLYRFQLQNTNVHDLLWASHLWESIYSPILL